VTSTELRAFDLATPESLARLRAAMAAETSPLDGPSMTGREICDYSDDPEFAIPPASYRVAATNTTRSDEAEADSKTAAMDKARTLSAGTPGVSFGVYAVSDRDGSCLVASFFNGERKFTALDEQMSRLLAGQEDYR